MPPPLSLGELDRTLGCVTTLLERGYGPSVREVAAGLGVSVAAAHNRLHRLRDEGLIVWEPSQIRTIRLTRGDA